MNDQDSLMVYQEANNLTANNLKKIAAHRKK